MPQLVISAKNKNIVYYIDLDTMELAASKEVGANPYPIDSLGVHGVIVSTRGANSVDIIAPDLSKRTIALIDAPRSCAYLRDSHLVAVSHKTLSSTTIFDLGTATEFVVGYQEEDRRRDFGGSLATGHPAWIANDHVLHLDRIARRIELWRTNLEGSPEGRMLDSINLPTSAHHIEEYNGEYVVMCEGNLDSKTPASILKFNVMDDEINVIGQVFFPHIGGGHHLGISPNGTIFAGTHDGTLIRVSFESLEILGMTKAGAGAGHITFCGELAVVTNHNDKFMTVISVSTGTKIHDIKVSELSKNRKKTQGHTSWWNAATEKLYTTAAAEGRVLEIDPSSGEITRFWQSPHEKGSEPAYLIQGCIINSN